MLTTHFVQLCNLLDKNKNIANENMEQQFLTINQFILIK